MSVFTKDWWQKALAGALTFGSKNAPTIMTGSGVVLGWAAVYVFWKQSRKAEKQIEKIELDRFDASDKPTEEAEAESKLTKKEKAVVYLQYCWMALIMGLGSTGLTLVAHKMDLARIAEMYMLTHFLEDKNADQEKLIEKMKAEIPEKQMNKIEHDIRTEKYPEETVFDGPIEETGNGPTLFIMDVGDLKFRSSVTAVQSGILMIRERLREKRNQAIKRRLGDAFFSADSPYPNDMTGDIYASMDLDVFIEELGIKKRLNLGDLLEFRDYGWDNYMSINDTMDYEKYTDPVTGVPSVCFLNIKQYLKPSYELMERDPL